jgi:hypothetical protein
VQRDGLPDRSRAHAPQYTSVRSDNLHFAVASGHETTEIERVVDEFDRYTVVAKMPAG